jgi:hypothetical protein
MTWVTWAPRGIHIEYPGQYPVKHLDNGHLAVNLGKGYGSLDADEAGPYDDAALLPRVYPFADPVGVGHGWHEGDGTRRHQEVVVLDR